MSKETGGQAFPWVESHTSARDGERVENYGDAGMTLRDYFAAKAMSAMTAAPIGKFDHKNSDEVVADAYVIADAMLRARGQ